MNKREILLVTALKLFVENGFHGTATSKIAMEANVATGTLFNYFSTKEELIVVLYHSVIKDMDDFILERMESHSVSKDAFRSLFKATLLWSIENPIHFQYLQQFNHSPYAKIVSASMLNREDQPLFILIKNGIDIVLIKQLPVAFIYSLFTAQISGCYEYILSTNLTEEKQIELSEEAFEMFWKIIED